MSKDSGKPTPNDQRSNSMNPNNPAHKSAQDNRSNQMNPNNPRNPSNMPGNTSGTDSTPDTSKKR